MRQRLDQVLVARGLVQSRARAADLIARGAVVVNGVVAAKAGQLVEADAELGVESAANAYVSRSGAKLKAALSRFEFSARDRVALDVGASTGGFTQVLLEAGARKVYAVEVGAGQLHELMRGDPRVVCLERVDARSLDRHVIPEPVGAIVADVSFISLKDVLPAPLKLAGAGCWLVALVKPQFEAGRGATNKRGVVRDDAARQRVVRDVAVFLEQAGWRVLGELVSPLPGKEGNMEWLVGAIKDEG